MITLLADDLTGAAEVAGVCLRYGWSVVFGVNILPTGDAQVRVIATDSRSMSGQEARMIHRQLAEEIGKTSGKQVFKKTDSILRGHVVAELDEWMDVLGFEKAVLQPANPAIGRCIQEGCYFVEGKPLNETAFREDAEFPAWSSSVEALLMERNGNRSSRKIITGTELFQKKGIHVPDCVDVEDLIKSVHANDSTVLHAGSAAFLAAWLQTTYGLTEQPRSFKTNPMTGRFLMICGSKHAKSEQYIVASKKRGLAVAEFPEDFLKENLEPGLLEEWADNLAEFWGRTGQMLVTQGHKQVSFPGCAPLLRSRLATVVQHMLEQCTVGELLLEGGATAFALLEKKGWTNLIPLEEYSPGIVRMSVMGVSNLFLTLKPGSYCWPDWQGIQTEDVETLDITE
jgi:D-threonate/D-erythronate kinase